MLPAGNCALSSPWAPGCVSGHCIYYLPVAWYICYDQATGDQVIDDHATGWGFAATRYLLNALESFILSHYQGKLNILKNLRFIAVPPGPYR